MKLPKRFINTLKIILAFNTRGLVGEKRNKSSRTPQAIQTGWGLDGGRIEWASLRDRGLVAVRCFILFIRKQVGDSTICWPLALNDGL